MNKHTVLSFFVSLLIILPAGYNACAADEGGADNSLVLSCGDDADQIPVDVSADAVIQRSRVRLSASANGFGTLLSLRGIEFEKYLKFMIVSRNSTICQSIIHSLLVAEISIK
jgi:hypothetical protein